MYVIKTEIKDARAVIWAFERQKTMYGGKQITKGDIIFIFASENEGGAGLIAKGIVTEAEPTPPREGVERQTPRVSIKVKATKELLIYPGQARWRVALAARKIEA